MDDGTTEEAKDAVRRDISALFARWTALRLAVENYDGPDRTRNVPAEVLDTAVMLAQDPDIRHPQSTFESLFYDGFDLLNTDVEDGSVEQIAKEVCWIRDAANRGDFGPANEAVAKTEKRVGGGGLEAKAAKLASPAISEKRIESPAQSISSQEKSLEETQSRQNTDDDGFTTVLRKKRRDRRG